MNDNTESRDMNPSTEHIDRRVRNDRDSNGSEWRSHLRFGWYALLFFLVLGAALEMFHGFKADFYLNVANETRRLLWTLAHAHGTLLALVNIVFALTARSIPEFSTSARRFASRCLIASTILLPGGFFFGGMFVTAGDPGLPVLLVPVGAILMFLGVFVIARLCSRSNTPDSAPASQDRRDQRKTRQKALTRA